MTAGGGPAGRPLASKPDWRCLLGTTEWMGMMWGLGRDVDGGGSGACLAYVCGVGGIGCCCCCMGASYGAGGGADCQCCGAGSVDMTGALSCTRVLCVGCGRARGQCTVHMARAKARHVRMDVPASGRRGSRARWCSRRSCSRSRPGSMIVRGSTSASPSQRLPFHPTHALILYYLAAARVPGHELPRVDDPLAPARAVGVAGQLQQVRACGGGRGSTGQWACPMERRVHLGQRARTRTRTRTCDDEEETDRAMRGRGGGGTGWGGGDGPVK